MGFRNFNSAKLTKISNFAFLKLQPIKYLLSTARGYQKIAQLIVSTITTLEQQAFICYLKSASNYKISVAVQRVDVA